MSTTAGIATDLQRLSMSNRLEINIGQTVAAKGVNFIVIRVQESCFNEMPALHCKRLLKKTKKPGKRMVVLNEYSVINE